MQIPGKLIKLQQWIDEGSQTVIQFWPLKNKNYYVVRNAGYARSRYTLKLSLIFNFF